MDLTGATRELFRTINLLLERVWGGQSSTQATLEAEAATAKLKKWAALAALRKAQEEGDTDAMVRYAAAANDWDMRLRQLLAEARAKCGP